MRKLSCVKCKTKLLFATYSIAYYCPNKKCGYYLRNVFRHNKVKRIRKKKVKIEVIIEPIVVSAKKTRPKISELKPELYQTDTLKALKAYLISIYGDKCMRCNSNKRIVLEHIKSRYKGGTNEISNLQLLCWSCNGLKGHKEWDFRPFLIKN